MGKITIKYSELANGMQVWVEGHLFVAQNVRTFEDPEGNVVRFEGYLTDPSDDCFLTGYNGGTYGGKADRHCAVEVPALTSPSPIFFIVGTDTGARVEHHLRFQAAVSACQKRRGLTYSHHVVDAWGNEVFPALAGQKPTDSWSPILTRMNEQRNAFALTIVALRHNQGRLLSMLETMRSKYGALHDGLTDMIGDSEGEQRLSRANIPDDYEWLAGALAGLVVTDHECSALLKEIKGE